MDHDHKTGKNRELLCHKCNVLLSYCNEDPVILESMRNYPIKHSNMEREFTFQHD